MGFLRRPVATLLGDTRFATPEALGRRSGAVVLRQGQWRPGSLVVPDEVFETVAKHRLLTGFHDATRCCHGSRRVCRPQGTLQCLAAAMDRPVLNVPSRRQR